MWVEIDWNTRCRPVRDEILINMIIFYPYFVPMAQFPMEIFVPFFFLVQMVPYSINVLIISEIQSQAYPFDIVGCCISDGERLNGWLQMKGYGLVAEMQVFDFYNS